MPISSQAVLRREIAQSNPAYTNRRHLEARCMDAYHRDIPLPSACTRRGPPVSPYLGMTFIVNRHQALDGFRDSAGITDGVSSKVLRSHLSFHLPLRSLLPVQRDSHLTSLDCFVPESNHPIAVAEYRTA